MSVVVFYTTLPFLEKYCKNITCILNRNCFALIEKYSYMAMYELNRQTVQTGLNFVSTHSEVVAERKPAAFPTPPWDVVSSPVCQECET